MADPFDPLAHLEYMSQVIEMTSGYRAKCEAAGFSPSAAEVMATDFHEAFVAAVFDRRGQQ